MIGDHIRQWREHRGMTRAALGKVVGRSARTVGAIEAGKRDVGAAMLRNLAEALRVPVGALVDGGPGEGVAEVLDAWAAIPESARADALAILKGLRVP
jgi:transcriptional regulator with XRE-family HTH domain